MEDFLNPQRWFELWSQAEAWFRGEVLVPSTLLQLVSILLGAAIARFLSPPVRNAIIKLSQRRGTDYWLARAGDALARLTTPMVGLLVIWLMALVAQSLTWPHHLLTITLSLLAAWVVIGIVSNLIRNRVISQGVATIAWFIAALNILGLLDSLIGLLDGAAFSVGEVRISALAVVQGMIALAILLWAATVLGDILERRISKSQNLTPSVQVLFAKLLKIVLFAAAIVVALETVGIDLSAFTVFTGALGVGIGFGLQKTVSNLISGVMILMDKSISPGDVIEVAGTYGWVNSLGSRYCSVITRDGIEHLIPNEELITTRVSNWSFSDDVVRMRVPLGISYDSDLRKAIELCVEAANECERALSDPRPVCLVKGFGDSSVDLELRFWINDPKNGIGSVKSDVFIRIWDKFHAEGIRIPFPQRDLHIRDSVPLFGKDAD